MDLEKLVPQKIIRTKLGARLMEDPRYRLVANAVLRLIFNLLFAFYNGILGIVSSSSIFVASSVYYLLLCIMRFAIVLRSGKQQSRQRQAACLIGVMLMLLSPIFAAMVFLSMKDHTATLYGTIPMITIATFTFTKITAAVITAVKHRKDHAPLFQAINAIRYSEVAVSLLTMQQSMLISFGDGSAPSSVILNAFTGGAVCFFILGLGILTFKNSRKES